MMLHSSLIVSRLDYVLLLQLWLSLVTLLHPHGCCPHIRSYVRSYNGYGELSCHMWLVSFLLLSALSEQCARLLNARPDIHDTQKLVCKNNAQLTLGVPMGIAIQSRYVGSLNFYLEFDMLMACMSLGHASYFLKRHEPRYLGSTRSPSSAS